MFARVSIYEIPGERAAVGGDVVLVDEYEVALHVAPQPAVSQISTTTRSRESRCLSADAQRPPADSIRSAISTYPRS